MPLPPPAPAAAPALPEVPAADVLGVPLALIDYEGTLDWMDRVVETGGPGYVFGAAPHTLMGRRAGPTPRPPPPSGPAVRTPSGAPPCWARISRCPTASRSCGR